MPYFTLHSPAGIFVLRWHRNRLILNRAIIRGGGAVTDLNYLNQLSIAQAITYFAIPVFTGIGHQKDKTILDEVAFRSFDTPSKVIGHIRHCIEHNARP